VDDSKDTLGIVIKNTRVQAGMTRKEFAAKLHITPRHLMSIENSHQKPSYNLLYRLVRELTISADTIFYPELSNAHMERDRTAVMLYKCNEKEFSIITATLQYILKEKHTTTEDAIE
jgi:transcriptional regulator with XRE-family HTH domain